MSKKVLPPQNLVVLVGAGYANIEILKQHAISPLPNSEVILITPRPTKFLRSMLPWVISGEILRQKAEIDLLKLCKISGAQLLLGEVDQIDLTNKSVHLKNGGSVFFDYLSMNVGTEMKTSIEGPKIVAGNRLEYLLDSFDKLLGKSATPKISIYGQSTLTRLITRGIKRLKIPVELKNIDEFNSDKNTDGADLVIIADEGKIPSLFAKSAFAMEDDKILVNDALQLMNCKHVFVAGPGTMVQGHLVPYNPYRPSHRFGKTIAENIRRDLKEKPLIVFRAEHSLVSWLPRAPDRVSLTLSRLRSERWKKWLARKRKKKSTLYSGPVSGEVLRSNTRNTASTLICAQARLEGVEPQWMAQIMGRQIIHQSALKRVGTPATLQARLQLRTNQSSRNLVRTKISQVQAGLESINSSSLEVRVSTGAEEAIHLSSDATYRPNLQLKSGDLVYLIGKLGSVQSLYNVLDDSARADSWFELRSNFNRDFQKIIEEAFRLGAVDGNVLDERGLVRTLEDLVVPNNLGVSLDLDRIPLYSVDHKPSVDRLSTHIRQNLEHAKYLPDDLETLMHHPRFLSIFGAELSGLILILPKEDAKQVSSSLLANYSSLVLTPIGALTEGPVRFRFRLTTK